MKYIIKLTLTILSASFFLSCSTQKGLMYSSSTVPAGSRIAVIIDSPNNIKNAVLVSFMKKGFRVKAFNSSDLYTQREIFDISDLKRISYEIDNDSLPTLEKTYENAYKLHIYNFELNKAEYLNKIRTQWDVEYLILLDLKDWESVSWARVINLRTLDLNFIENYPTKYSDNLESIVNHFIASISGR